MEIFSDSKCDLLNIFRDISWGAQGQLDTASHFVLALARKNVTYQSPYVQHIIRNIKQYAEETIPAVEKKYDDFQTNFHINDNERSLVDWASKQTYIALGNMMTSAALLGIDSCPIEGFDLDAVTELLKSETLSVLMILCLHIWQLLVMKQNLKQTDNYGRCYRVI